MTFYLKIQTFSRSCEFISILKQIVRIEKANLQLPEKSLNCEIYCKVTITFVVLPFSYSWTSRMSLLSAVCCLIYSFRNIGFF